MTLREWLDARDPQAPPALASRIESALSSDLERDCALAPELCIDAGIALTSALIASGSTSRETALDLLVADALLTYAFEAAAERPGEIDRRAEEAMTRISAIGA